MERRTSRLIDSLLAGALVLLGFLEGRAVLLGPRRSGHPAIEDEYVYLFQAKLLAHFHLSLPSPPLPEFFEAAHLLVVPRFAAKYLPGHALLLAPFEALGRAWMGPALGLGFLAAFLFLCGRAARFSRGAALVAGILPLVTEPVASVFDGYLSWTSSLPVAAAGLACALAAYHRRSAKALAAASLLAGLLFWIRPFSGLALYGTLAIVVLLRARRAPALGRWLLAAVVPLAAWALLTGLVCKSVTGRFTELPWALYARQYMPGDGPGFGPTHAPPPERVVPPHLRPLVDDLHRLRERYTPAAALARIPEDLRTVATLEPTGWLWPLALLGALACADALLPVLAFALLFFAAQMTFYGPTPFYFLDEALPLALGFAGAAHRLLQLIRSREHPAARGAALIAASLPAMALATGAVLSTLELIQFVNAQPWMLAEEEAAIAPAARVHGLVFIRYSAQAYPNVDLGYNEPDLRHAPLVRARDLGPRNQELMAAFPDRPAFLFNAGTLALTPIPREPIPREPIPQAPAGAPEPGGSAPP